MIKVLHVHSYNLDSGFCPLNREYKRRPGHFVLPYRTGKNSLSIAAACNQKEVLQWKKSNEKCVMSRGECSKIYWKIRLCVKLCASVSVYQGCMGENTNSTNILYLALKTLIFEAFRSSFFNGALLTDPIYDSFKFPICIHQLLNSVPTSIKKEYIKESAWLCGFIFHLSSEVRLFPDTLCRNSPILNFKDMKIVFLHTCFKHVRFSAVLHTVGSSASPRSTKMMTTNTVYTRKHRKPGRKQRYSTDINSHYNMKS